VFVIIWLMYIIIVIYNIVDYYQSCALFVFGFEEANPLIAWAVNIYGVESILYIKVGVLVILGGLLACYTCTKKRHFNLLERINNI